MLVVARGPSRERLSSGVRSYATKKSPKKVPLKIESPVVHETRESLPGGTKVLTVPFMMSPDHAKRALEAAAAAAYGGSNFLNLFGIRFMRRFGYDLDAGFKRVAFKAFLLPTWQMDVALEGPGEVKEKQVDVQVSAEATLAGFEYHPLSDLSLNAEAGVELEEAEPFDARIHSNQQGLDITTLPFTLSPMKMLSKIALLPKMDDKKISIYPARMKPILFAGYPLLLPIYLAEFVDKEERRVTTVAFATSKRGSCAVYPSFQDEPSWKPNPTSLILSVAGVSSAAEDSPMMPGSLNSIQPEMDRLIARGRELTLQDPIESLADVERRPDVMKWDLSAGNKAYIKAASDVLSAVGALRQVAAIGDSDKALVRTSSSFEILSGTEARTSLQRKVAAAKRRMEILRPRWMD